jgi:general secretion pathway protein H
VELACFRPEGTRRSAHGDRGFTLLELMVVMALLALVMVMMSSAPMPGRGHAEAGAAVRQIAAALRQARSEAITQNREIAFTIDVERRLYRAGPHGPVALPVGTDIVLDTVQSEQIDETSGSIRFYPDGSSTGGRILLTGEHRQDAVTVSWLTGRVAIE